jgi:hypothetical protein
MGNGMIPKHLGYVRRIADKGKLLSKLPSETAWQ